jgi:DNA modification methylase
MKEIPDRSVHLVVTLPPYFNAPFDYPDLYKEYSDFLDMIGAVTKELKRVLAMGRVACFVTQDVRINGTLLSSTRRHSKNNDGRRIQLP